MKKIVKYILYTVASLLAFIILYIIAALGLAAVTVNKHPSPQGNVAIYIKTNGVHTDLVVPLIHDQQNWSKKILCSHAHLQNTTAIQYLGMGWGNRSFYLETPTWADLRASVALQATVGLGRTAIHTTFYGVLPETASCRKVMLSNLQYEKLVNCITGSFRKDSAGHVMQIITNANYNDADAFYEANGHYSLFYTCNTWANSGLKAAGQKACLWTPYDQAICKKYK